MEKHKGKVQDNSYKGKGGIHVGKKPQVTYMPVINKNKNQQYVNGYDKLNLLNEDGSLKSKTYG